MLPDSFLKKGLELSKGCKFIGIPLEDFTKEELLAIAVMGWKAEQNAREQGLHDVEFLMSLR